MSNNLNYTQLVEKSEFPRQAEVPLDDFFNDARGEITNLLLGKFFSTLLDVKLKIKR